MYDFENITDPKRYNRLFLKKLNEEGGVKKAESAVRNFIQLRIRERGFARNVLPPEVVTAEDCQNSEDHDLLTKLVPRAFDNTSAMAVNFMGDHDGRFIRGDRVRAKFYKIMTKEYSIQEGQILAFAYPVVEWIEKISVKDLERVEDEKFIELSDAAVAATGKIINSPATALDKQVITTHVKMLNGDELQHDCFLMHKVDHDDWSALPATVIGSQLAGEVTKDGWKYSTLQGHRLVTSIKNVITPGHIYGYTKPDMLGVFYLLGDTKFAIKKDYDFLYMKSWHYASMLFANNRAVSKTIMKVPNPLTGVAQA